MTPSPTICVANQRRFAIHILLGCLLFSGCGSPPPVVQTEQVDRLSLILEAVRAHVEQKNQPPKNQEELLPFLEKLGNPQELLISPRDGQPYTIVWGTNPFDFSTIDPNQPLGQMLAYEQTGADGVRFVVTAHGVLSVEEKEFETLRGAGKKP